jgi:hypothetical protein
MINTGINIDTVRLSNCRPHVILNHSLSIHLNKYRETGILLNPTSKKTNIAKIVVIITLEHVIICDPDTPAFLPKKPDAIDPNKGNIIILKYIIYILSLCYLLIYKKLQEYLNL